MNPLAWTGPLKPFTASESRKAFASDPEWDSLEATMARLSVTGKFLIRPDAEEAGGIGGLDGMDPGACDFGAHAHSGD